MNGFSANGVKLFLGKVPGRKQECFYFEEGATCYPVAYISKQSLLEAKRLWAKLLGEKEAQ